MPEYTYKCIYCGGRAEVVKPIRELDTPEKCHCGQDMTRIIIGGYSHGDSAWIRDANEALSDEFSPLIETRSDLKKRMKELGVVHAG